jgi:hypothetical protein
VPPGLQQFAALDLLKNSYISTEQVSKGDGMKSFIFGILITTAISCGQNSDNDKDNKEPVPAPAADQTPMAGFLLSEQQHFAVKLVWNNPPISQSFDNSAELYFLDHNGQAVTESQVTRFHLYMASMGHPSIKEKEMVFTQVDPGHWTISRIFFSMGGSAGSWVVDLDAVVNGKADHIRVSIDHEVE